VCVRCFWVWFGAESLTAFAAAPMLERPRPLLADASPDERVSSGAEARRVLGSLGAGEIAAALPRVTRSRRR